MIVFPGDYAVILHEFNDIGNGTDHSGGDFISH
jgi:hypothetical protein